MVKVKNSTRRKLAIASWSSPREGNIYGKLTLDAGPVQDYIAEVRERTGAPVTVTHVVGRAVAAALEKEPTLNGYLRFGRYHAHDTVSLAFLVALEDGADLAPARVTDVHTKSPAEIATELAERVTRLRNREDDDFEASKPLISALPSWLLRPLVATIGWLSSSVGMSVKALGVRPFPFGSAIITSVGMFGIDEAFVPPTPFARVPLYVLIGAVRDVPVVVDGAIVVRPQLTVTATIDHRFVDGYQAAVLANALRDAMAHPSSLG